jgi:hypothetical protein
MLSPLPKYRSYAISHPISHTNTALYIVFEPRVTMTVNNLLGVHSPHKEPLSHSEREQQQVEREWELFGHVNSFISLISGIYSINSENYE